MLAASFPHEVRQLHIRRPFIPSKQYALYAAVVKLADTPDLGSCTERCIGSTPISGTISISSYKEKHPPIGMFFFTILTFYFEADLQSLPPFESFAGLPLYFAIR